MASNPPTGRSAMANGNITSLTPVMQDTGTDNRVIAATSGALCLGIAGKGTRYAPWSVIDDGYLAISGEVFEYYGQGEDNVPAKINGTVTRGDLLKADGTSLISTTADGDKYVAQARMSGVAGDIIPVLVMIGERGV